MTDVALGIDLGTGSTKAGLVDDEGRLVATARADHAIESPRAGWSESDPEGWWASAKQAVTGVLGSSPGARVRSIGVCGQMHGVVLCDASAVPTRAAVLWADRRALPLLDSLGRRLAPDLAALANPLTPGMAGPVLAALQHSEPQTIANARWVLQPKDWLRFRMTRRACTEPSDCSATLMWDIPADTWRDHAREVFEVPAGLLPPVLPSAAVAGQLQPAEASALGLPPGIPVATGAADAAAALLGAGVRAGQAQLSVGTGGQITILLAAPVLDASRRTHLYRAADHDTQRNWYAMAAIQNAGLAIDWALRVLGATPEDAARAVHSSPPGAHGVCFHPYLTGERTPHLDSGLRGNWSGLHERVTRSDVIRSVYEGVAFALRDGLDALRAAGHIIDTLLLAGGGTLENWWRQLLADGLAVPLLPLDSFDASVRGAGLLGWAAVDHRPDPAAQVGRGSAVEPQTTAYLGALTAFREAGPSPFEEPS